MLLTSRSGAAAVPGAPAVRSVLMFLLTVFLGGLGDLRAHEVRVRLPQARDPHPRRAVPPLEVGARHAAVIVGRQLDWRDQAGQSEFAQPRVGEVEMLEAPPHLRS